MKDNFFKDKKNYDSYKKKKRQASKINALFDKKKKPKKTWHEKKVSSTFEDDTQVSVLLSSVRTERAVLEDDLYFFTVPKGSNELLPLDLKTTMSRAETNGQQKKKKKT